MVHVNQLGVESLYTSSPGSVVDGYVGVDNSGENQTLDVLWGSGVLEGDNFGFYGLVIGENIFFAGLSSTNYYTGTFATPNTPGTWDLIGILADDITYDGTTISVTGQRAVLVSQGAWTISGAVGGINVASVGVTAG